MSAFTDRKYDYVISDQVVEHLHPSDIISHFTEAKKILKAGGSYIFRAPNAHRGPQDLSLVFGEKRAVFMHLHEFEWREMPMIAKQCGYARVQAVFKLPLVKQVFASSLYYKYLQLVERFIKRSPRLVSLATIFCFPTQVWVVLTAD